MKGAQSEFIRLASIPARIGTTREDIPHFLIVHRGNVPLAENPRPWGHGWCPILNAKDAKGTSTSSSSTLADRAIEAEDTT